jgi:hypothetical protein
LLIADRIGNYVQIFEGQRKVFREGAVMRNDAKHGSASAVRFQAPPAEGANRAITVSRTRHIDLTHNAPPDPPSPLSFGNAVNLRDLADKLVPRRTAKIMIPAQNLNIGVANSSQPDTDKHPALP